MKQKAKCSILKNANTYLHIIAIVSLCIVLVCGFKSSDNEINKGVSLILQNIAYGYIGGYIVYILTVLLKNKIERQRAKWLIWGCVKRLNECVSNYIKTTCGIRVTESSTPNDIDVAELSNFITKVESQIGALDRFRHILNHCNNLKISQITDVIDCINETKDNSLKNKDTGKYLGLNEDDKKIITEMLRELLNLTGSLYDQFRKSVSK